MSVSETALSVQKKGRKRRGRKGGGQEGREEGKEGSVRYSDSLESQGVDLLKWQMYQVQFSDIVLGLHLLVYTEGYFLISQCEC